jgi:putative NADH-flavin reductase
MNILIIGGTRGIGLEVAKQALEAGHRVTLLARHPEKTPLSHPNLRIEKGDAFHPEDVRRAVAGQDVVVSALGIGPTRKPVIASADWPWQAARD